MIRRGFWLAAGAVMGVTGYRKATRLARTLTGQADSRRPAAIVVPGPRSAATGRQRLALPGREASRQQGSVAATVARAAAAAGFVRDVREGMAEYWDLHREESDLTLECRSDRMSPVENQRGRCEP